MTLTPTGSRRVRVLVTVIGLDQHEAGALFVARILRDAGHEVIYTGRFNTPQTIAEIAAQEDVDVVGISAHSWEFLHYAEELVMRLNAAEPPIPAIVGGSIVTEQDAREATAKGLHVARAGATEQDIVEIFARLAAGAVDPATPGLRAAAGTARSGR
jgi:methylmalonyl-CoA mutase C-terminal domain/subunit